jgi:hypothetical protein
MSGYKGIYEKYEIKRKETGEICDGCFVLRPVTDIAARVGLAAYAEATHNPRLAIDIRKWLRDLRQFD